MRYMPCEHGDVKTRKCCLESFPRGCPVVENYCESIGKTEVLNEAFYEKWRTIREKTCPWQVELANLALDKAEALGKAAAKKVDDISSSPSGRRG